MTWARVGTGGTVAAVCGLLSACASPGPAPSAPVAGGPVGLEVAGQRFLADLQPGPVLWIGRDPALENFEGRIAKDVAMQFCVRRGAMLDPQALGHFDGGRWLFKGGCV